MFISCVMHVVVQELLPRAVSLYTENLINYEYRVPKVSYIGVGIHYNEIVEVETVFVCLHRKLYTYIFR